MRMRKQKKKIRIVIVTLVGVLSIMTIGYSAFQTNLNITAKGNIGEVQILSTTDLCEDLVTSGNGIYKDEFEERRCLYRGESPNNYIEFNGEPWRIISVETDGTLKIVSDEILPSQPFDEANVRTAAYCNYSQDGCNMYGSASNTYKLNGTNATTMPTIIGGEEFTTPTEESTINQYLNGTYYNETLKEEARKYIVSHEFNVGHATYYEPDIETQVNQEKAYYWKGNVGLISASDYVRANYNFELCKTTEQIYSNSAACKKTNYLNPESGYYWTITPNSYSDSRSCLVLRVYSFGQIINSFATGTITGVRPSVYLTSDIKLAGSGKKDDPYTIVN